MRKIAWIIMIGGFMLFCTSSVALTVGVYFYFFESNIILDTVVEVGRGTAVIEDTLRQQATRDGLNFLGDFPSEISTDGQSQATISFKLGEGEETRSLATLTLKNNSSVRIMQAQQPRFDWSNGIYFVDLDGFTGELDIFINERSDRPLRIQVHTLDNSTVLLDNPGLYTVSVDDDSLLLAVRRGVAALISADNRNNRLVTSRQEAELVRGRETILKSGMVNLLDNGFFTYDADVDLAEPFFPQFWQCSNPANELPRGANIADVWEGRLGLRLVRRDTDEYAANASGESGCEQRLAPENRDVSGYNYIELQTTFLLNYQELSECGVQGSECPLMLYMNYEDSSGVTRNWYRGFYSFRNPLSDWPLRCDSCDEPHNRINEKVWYTYSTGNILALLPEDARPARINSVKFYASGHEYDVFVSEIALQAGNRVIPPTDNLQPLNAGS